MHCQTENITIKNWINSGHNVRDRPTNLVQVRSVEIGSAEASSNTIRQRSKFYERLETIRCARKDSAEPEQDVVQQRSSLNKRNKEGYFKAAKIAGLAILTNLNLTLKQHYHSKGNALNLWKTVKRTLNDSFGVDLMGTERREGLRKHGEFEYEMENSLTPLEKLLHFFELLILKRCTELQLTK